MSDMLNDEISERKKADEEARRNGDPAPESEEGEVVNPKVNADTSGEDSEPSEEGTENVVRSKYKSRNFRR